MSDQATFTEELRALINRHSMENGSDTPDFILADYLVACLVAFNETENRRRNWYSPRKLIVDEVSFVQTEHVPEGDLPIG